MTFLEALSYIPRPAPSPHDTADDASLSSDLDDEQAPAVDYWNEDEDDERMR